MSRGKTLWSHAARLGFAWRRARKDPAILTLPDGEAILDLHAEALQRLGRHLRPLNDADNHVNLQRARGDVQDAVATLLPLATRTSCTLRFPGPTAPLDSHSFVDVDEQSWKFDLIEEDLVPLGPFLEDAVDASTGKDLDEHDAGRGREIPTKAPPTLPPSSLLLPPPLPSRPPPLPSHPPLPSNPPLPPLLFSLSPPLPPPLASSLVANAFSSALVECMEQVDALAQAMQDELALQFCLETLTLPLPPPSPPPPPPPSSRRASRASRRHQRDFQNASRRDARGSTQPVFEQDRAFLAAEAAYEQAVARGDYAADLDGWLAWEAAHAHEFPPEPFAAVDEDDFFDAFFLWQGSGSDLDSD